MYINKLKVQVKCTKSTIAAEERTIWFLYKTDKKHKKREVSNGELLKKTGFCGRIKPSKVVSDIVFYPGNFAERHSNRKRKGKS